VLHPFVPQLCARLVLQENQDDGFEELLAPDKDEDEAPDDEGEGLEDDDALLTFTGGDLCTAYRPGLPPAHFVLCESRRVSDGCCAG